MYYLPVLIANHGPTTTSTTKRDGIITVKVKLGEEAVDDNGHKRLRGGDDVLLHVLNTDHVDDSVEGGEGALPTNWSSLAEGEKSASCA